MLQLFMFGGISRNHVVHAGMPPQAPFAYPIVSGNVHLTLFNQSFPAFAALDTEEKVGTRMQG